MGIDIDQDPSPVILTHPARTSMFGGKYRGRIQDAGQIPTRYWICHLCCRVEVKNGKRQHANDQMYAKFRDLMMR